MKATKKEYRALLGISYPDGKGGEIHLERGDSVPAAVIEGAPWLLEGHPIAPAELISDAEPFDHDFSHPAEEPEKE